MDYGVGEISTGVENFVWNLSDEKNIHYLVITDSRGGMTNNLIFKDSFLFKLKEFFNQLNQTYLIISRPKNLTIFATLYNFLNLNPDIRFKYLITNLGFVDCTPKKQKNIEDILCQIKQFSNTENKIVEYEDYSLSNGNSEVLKNLEYSQEYVTEISNLFSDRFYKCYFINTPTVDKNTKMIRKRPDSFFIQIQETNKLINNIVVSNRQTNVLIDISTINDTYDGVHYTKEGHSIIFDKIKESIKL